MSVWVSVVLEEGGEAVEIPTESSGTLLLTSVTAQFPGAIGLRYRNPQTNTLRGVRLTDNELFPPESDGWGDGIEYVCVVNKKDTQQDAVLKRKFDNSVGGGVSKNLRVDGTDNVPIDLIVLGLAWQSNEQDIRDYFTQFGELEMVSVKYRSNGESKGFAFIRFANLSSQEKVLMTRHMIDGRWCDTKIPESVEMKSKSKETMHKIFVGRITESITQEDLMEHFEQFGVVSDIYIPKPFRAFAFVSFEETHVAESLLGKDHTIKGASVHIGSAQPKRSGAMRESQTHMFLPSNQLPFYGGRNMHNNMGGGFEPFGTGGFGGPMYGNGGGVSFGNNRNSGSGPKRFY